MIVKVLLLSVSFIVAQVACKGTANRTEWAVSDKLYVQYLQCIDQQFVNPSKLLIISIDQQQLTSPAPLACGKACRKIGIEYVYTLIHIPATGKHVNKLVCGCGVENALEATWSVAHTKCNLPCPEDANSAVDSKKFNEKNTVTTTSAAAAIQSAGTETIRAERFRSIIHTNQQNVANNYYTPANYRTCGNGVGLLSAYIIVNESTTIHNCSLLIVLMATIGLFMR